MPDFTPDLSRRTALTALGAVGAAAMSRPSLAAGIHAKEASLRKAIERLRVAMVDGDGPTLAAMLDDRLAYMHSSGHAQTKANLLDALAGKHVFASLAYPEQTIEVVGTAGLVIQTVDQVKNLPGGKTRASRIKVMQTWVQVGGTWKLLARMSAIISSPLMRPDCSAAPAAASA